MDVDLDRALHAAFEAAKSSRQVLLSYFGRLSQVSEKDQAGLVSEADVESERVCVQVLRSFFPDFGILGEEGTEKSYTEESLTCDDGLWVVDPLDGTTNYVHQFPIYCISIALQWKQQLQVGLIDVPRLKKTYWAVRGRGAYVRDYSAEPAQEHRMSISQRHDLTHALLATGFNAYDKKGMDEQLAIFSNMVRRCRGVRRAGSAAFDLCLVAEGVFDAYWEKNLKSWDMAAGALLVQEAGGVVTDYAGGQYKTNASSIIVGNPVIHGEVLRTIKSCTTQKY